ncbi:MAG: hypothetical protein HYS13_14235 [Planctomycetia bacterium]|nr:hypothetical protein [Planctomycetia bacterium]
MSQHSSLWSAAWMSLVVAGIAPSLFAAEVAREAPPAKKFKLRWGTSYKTMLYPVLAEVYVRNILNRDEFRAHCDTYRSRGAILGNLQ